jgi:D-beta-D-heptose 7-phosphate kinase/D-beta-D-heptose 1-phosphate adenosyltransferase
MSTTDSLVPETLVRFSNARIAVLGDVMLDRFVTGEVSRISPEAPIPVIRVLHQTLTLGGAGNVASNIVRLGGHAALIGVVGDDEPAKAVEAAAMREPRLSGAFVREIGRRTVVKTRFAAQGQQLLRVDEESVRDIDCSSADQILTTLESELNRIQVLVCSDYAKGALTRSVLSRSISMARKSGVRVIVDPKAQDLSRYAGATIITPNAHEASMATAIACDDDEGVAEAARKIADLVGCNGVVVTRGGEGMTILSRESGRDDVLHLATEARDVHDVSGAGDTVTAVLALASACDVPLQEAARLANIAAGIAVTKVGTCPVDAAELARVLEISALSRHKAKIVPLKTAAATAHAWRSKRERVVFTNGCFDLLHPGHVELLEKARSFGDRLIVALNSDESVRRLKGPTRPIQSEFARAIVMASIGVVDLVTIFTDDEPLAAIEAIRPDVLVKGADYTEEQVVGADLVRSYGGRIVLVPLAGGQSTTRVIARSGGREFGY